MCMGLSCLVILQPGRSCFYPHVYGATPDLKYLSTSSQGLSPCVWGHPGLHNSQHGCAGSIPMCMGPPSLKDFSLFLKGVYPHVYGATPLSWVPGNARGGLSPCVWGHPTFSSSGTRIGAPIRVCMRPS